MTIKAIITDIEGTTTDINFVHQVLFPYAREKMAMYLCDHQDDSNVRASLLEIQAWLALPMLDIKQITAQLFQWMDVDAKIGPLKTLQGYIWQKGFQSGHFTGHVYSDAYEHLINWHAQNIKLYIYSSGSVQAQQLLFQYSCFGDLRYLFSGYFDTQVGGKKEVNSYASILTHIQCVPTQALFLSDVVAELDAARQNNIQTMLLNRQSIPMEHNGHPMCSAFDQINFLELA